MSNHKLTRESVLKIADLARLELQDSEVESFAEELGAIFGHFESLAKIQTTGVVPLLTPTQIEPTVREDQVQIGLGAEKALMNAPEKQGNLFKVPPVVG